MIDQHEAVVEAAGRLWRSCARARWGHTQIGARLEAAYDWCMADIEAYGRLDVLAAGRDYREELDCARSAAATTIESLRDQWQAASAANRPAVAGWQDGLWKSYVPSASSLPPSSIRVGQLIDEIEGLAPLPALAGLVGSGHIFVKSDHLFRAEAIELLQSIALRVMVTAAPDAVRLILADPLSAGGNLAIFRRLPETLRGAKIWSHPQEIDEQLITLTEHIEDVIQDRLVTPELTFESYNTTMPEQQIRYQVLVLPDFPTAFSDRMIGGLIQVARNGPRAGVYLVVHIDTSLPVPRGDDLARLTCLGTTIEFVAADQVRWDDSLLGRHPVTPDQAPTPALVESLLTTVGTAATRVVSDLAFERIAIGAHEYWQGSSSPGLEVPIGLSSTGAAHPLRIGQDPGVVHHGLIGGTTGSGKGNLLHVLITQLALRYAPEELGLYLLDFKEGVEFQRYLNLPHAHAVALESEREFGLNVLRHLQEEMEERGRLFKSAGQGIAKLSDYRRQTGMILPRLLLIIDEFQVLFHEDDALSRSAAQILEDLAKRGRSAGIHVLLCSQSPATGGQVLNRIYDQMGLRIALQCRQRDAFAILGDGNDAAARLERVGEAIYNDRMGERDKNRTIRVARLRERDWQQVQSDLARLAVKRSYPRPATFDGRAPAHLEESPSLLAALSQHEWLGSSSAPLIWLGTPIDVKPPTGAALERQARSNLLIAGEDQARAYGVIVAAMISIAGQLSPSDVEFVVLDLARPDSPFAGYFSDLAAKRKQGTFAHQLSVANYRQSTAVVDELLERLAARIASGIAEPRIVVAVVGLQRWRELRGPDTLTQSDGAKRLTRLVDEGPEAGMNVILWADGLTTVEGVFKRGGFRYFDLRLALRLSLRDSTELLGNGAAASLADNRALFRHEDWELGRQEKCKPYQLPARDERDLLLELLRSKTAELERIDGT